ncbi:MAG: apolipoprotein N-acyltransferase [Spirochaetota bacterium]
MLRYPGRVLAAVYLGVSLLVTYVVAWSPVAIAAPLASDFLFSIILALHYVWGIVLLVSAFRRPHPTAPNLRRLLLVPELLAVASLLLFLFSFIYAMNANLDYVQRFIASGGNVRLALDTRTERLLVWVRVFPLVALNVVAYLLLRIGRPRAVRAAYDERRREPDLVVRPWGLLFVLLSAFLVSIAMPSFLSLDGFPLLGWIAFVPLFLVWRSARFGPAVLYGVAFGGFTTLLSSYWLGTFGLIALQVTVLFFLVYFALFTPIAIYLYRSVRFGRVFVLPLAFTLFEYLRSIGFLGYPWALAAHSQYSVLPIIQIAELTGVWGVSFLVLLANSAIAEFVGAAIRRHSERRTWSRSEPRRGATPASVRRSFGWLLGVIGLVGAVALGGGIVLAANVGPDPDARSVTVAQIQQNTDPRRNDYDGTLNTLIRLTNQAMAADPDIVVWSETAFVPNIRRWSEDDSSRRYHALVRRFLTYQEQLGTWLLTGNDDYELVRDAEGNEIDRVRFNAAVLFDDEGNRRETYRKIRLVPFTEYFPYREQFPRIYSLLLQFEMVFWEKGTEQTVFEHPQFTFSTPICYEDVFPDYVRGFVRRGAEVIVNISNDYWSLTEAQAKQHFAAGLFRAVENRRPLVRSTASGVTAHVDEYGRVLAAGPYFEPAFMISEVRVDPDQRTTLYTRWGDYFPLAAGGALLVLWIVSLAISGTTGRARTRRKRPARRAEPRAAKPRARKAQTDRARPEKPRRRKKGVDWRQIWNDE